MKTVLFNLLALSIGLISFFGLAGCGSDSGTVLAKVGNDNIYAQDIEDIYMMGNPTFDSFEAELENRKNLVDSLVRRQLFIREAYKKNIDKLDEINRIVLANEERFLLDVLYQREILGKVNVTTDDVQKYFDRLEFKVHASHILVTDKDSADLLIDSLANGANFENLAVQYSVDPTAKTNRGDIGFYVWGQLDSVFMENVWKLNPGEISKPFETRFGWHIARVIERQPNELRTSFSKMSGQIRNALEAQSRNAKSMDYSQNLQDRFPINLDTVTCIYLLNKRETLYPPSLLGNIPKNDFDGKKLDGHEKDLILATWDGGQLSLGQYLGMLRQVPNEQKPDFDNFEGMKLVIFQLNFNSILATEARRAGLLDDPEYKRKIRKFKEIAMADIMENDSLPNAMAPDEGEIRQYYEENQGEFMIPEEVYLYEIMFSDYSRANSYANKISSLERFKGLASQYTQRTGMKAKQGELGWITEAVYPRLFIAVSDAPIKDVVGPVQVGSKYSLLYVADRKPEAVRDFLQVKGSIGNNLKVLKQAGAVESWITEKMNEVDIKINENNIRSTIDGSKYDES